MSRPSTRRPFGARAALEALSEDLGAMHIPPLPKGPTTLDSLPEELLDQIISYFTPNPGPISATSTAHRIANLPRISHVSNLANLSLLSRKFNRITEPHLYHTIPVVLAEFERWEKVLVRGGADLSYAVPTTRGCNASLLLRTFKAHPQLAQHARIIIVWRHDLGFHARRQLGLYGYESGSPFKVNADDLALMEKSRVPLVDSYSLERSKPHTLSIEMDPVYNVFRELLRVLPRVERYEMSLYRTDAPWNTVLDALQSIGSLGVSFPRTPLPKILDSVKDVTLASCGDVMEYWPLFTLPALATLELCGAHFKKKSNRRLLRNWASLSPSSSLKDLTLSRILAAANLSAAENPMALLSRACTALTALRITQAALPGGTVARDFTRACISNFLLHLPTLRDVAIHDEYMRPISYNVLEALTLQDTMAQFRDSTGNLRHLILNAVDLTKLMPAKECHAEIEGIIWKKCTTTQSQRLFPRIDITLPRTLQTFTLRVRSEREHRAALFSVIRALGLDIRARFPQLKRFTICWLPGSGKPYGLQAHRGHVETFAEQGVELSEWVLDPPTERARLAGVDAQRVARGLGRLSEYGAFME